MSRLSSPRIARLLVALQIVLMVATLFAPIPAAAVDDPSADPSPTPSAEPTPDATPTPEATPAPDATPTPEPDATPTPEATPAPTPDTTPTPTPTPTPLLELATEPYIVTFFSGTSAADQDTILASVDAVETGSVPQLRMRTILLAPSTELESVAALQGDSRVARVDADRVRTAEAAPSDTDYPFQWSLPKIGWDEAYGTVAPAGSATVAVLDTGVDASHPDLAGNVVAGTSIIDGSDGLTDPNGHGTWMAGIIAAQTDNGMGVAGVGYAGVAVMPVTVLGADGTGSDSDVIAGVVWAVDHDADVILMAFSAPSYSVSLQAAIDYAWSNGVVLVAATGNDASSAAAFPAGDRGVIGVSNTDQNDALNASSNYGRDTFLGAPGTDIQTTDAAGGYSSVTGTSASAAEVAAAAALLKANDPSATNGVIAGRLARNADPAGTQDQTGNGRLNLARALADVSTDAVQPVGAAPFGSGGPFVGPYVAAARNWLLTFVGTGSVTITPSVGTVNAPVSCGGTGAAATSQTVTSTCSPNISTSDNDAVITLSAGAGFAGWSLATNVDSSGSIPAANKTCNDQTPVDLTNPCKLVFLSNGAITVTFVTVRSTSTSISCVPGSVVVGQGSVCTATVTDTATGTKTDPAGTMTFGSSGSGAFSAPGTSCTLVSDGNALTFTSSCSVTYTPSAVGTGTHTITGTYGGSATHTTSNGSFGLTVALRSTSTTVTCSPSTVSLNQATTCDAQVDDTASGTKSNPSGTVTFSRAGAGTGNFSSLTCTLTPVVADPDSSHCTSSVTYTPTTGANVHTVNASYGGASPHAASTDPDGFAVTVTERATSTDLSCVTPVAIDQASTCTVTVTDTSSGAASDPSGTVDFGTDNPGGAFSAMSCVLVGNLDGSSTCTVDYTGDTAGSDTIAATYNEASSAIHASSFDTFAITVHERTTTADLACDTPVSIDEASTCTITITDTDSGLKSDPSGTVSFGSSNGGGVFSNPGATCTLVSDALPTFTSSCTVDYTGDTAQVDTITATYDEASSLVHASNADTFAITIEKRTTATTVTCSPSSVAINQGTVCVASVDDTDSGTKSAPTGSVDFSRTGPGTGNFSSASCSLVAVDADSSACQVGYRPTSGAGAHVVTGDYQGSAVHKISGDSDTVTVHERTTTAEVDCPTSLAINEAGTCTVTVTDADAGSKSDPAGTVDFTRSGAGNGTFSSSSCSLVSDGSALTFTSTCSVTYTPVTGAGTHTVTATYNEASSLVHKSSAGSDNINASLRATQTTIACVPMVSPVGSAITCTATVADVDSAGTKLDPTGSATFTGEGGIFVPASGSCVLVSDGNPLTYTSKCSVTYNRSIAAIDTLTATYSGSAVHASSTSAPILVVFYDANGGFVTGGGWINVTAGSCQLTTVCGGATGKANFGFNSKYKKGASIPDGQTEFQFQAGNLNFHSEAYEWLVISGHKAQYRGTGEINGTTGYSFLLTAYDGDVNGGGGVDKFRIKIWRTSTGVVVFDSKMGTSDDVDLANPQAIEGGSIVIHK